MSFLRSIFPPKVSNPDAPAFSSGAPIDVRWKALPGYNYDESLRSTANRRFSVLTAVESPSLRHPINICLFYSRENAGALMDHIISTLTDIYRNDGNWLLAPGYNAYVFTPSRDRAIIGPDLLQSFDPVKHAFSSYHQSGLADHVEMPPILQRALLVAQDGSKPFTLQPTL